jgi:hypothetical protein
MARARWSALVLGMVTAVSVAHPASGDGARLQIRQPLARWIASVWTAPNPVRVGAVEVMVVLEPRDGRRPAAVGPIELEAWSSGRQVAHAYAHDRDPGSPRLLRMDLREPGPTRLRIRIGEGPEADEVETTLRVEPPLSPLREQWLALGLPFVAAALFSLRLWRERTKQGEVRRWIRRRQST